MDITQPSTNTKEFFNGEAWQKVEAMLRTEIQKVADVRGWDMSGPPEQVATECRARQLAVRALETFLQEVSIYKQDAPPEDSGMLLRKFR